MNRIALSIRTSLRNRILDIISVTAKPKHGVHILNGHFLSLDDMANPHVFDTLLTSLEQKGVKLVNFTDAVNLIKSKNIPRDECMVAFSWDDGFDECFTKIKPVLDKRNLKACFFINPNFVDGTKEYRDNFTENVVLVDKPPMNWEMIKTLRTEGHTIGAHTLDHLSLNSQDETFLTSQIVGSKTRIEEVLNDRVVHFAFPFGQLKHISELGVDIAFNNFGYVYSQSNYTNYFSLGGRVINRRHFECDWPVNHVVYFLKQKRL